MSFTANSRAPQPDYENLPQESTGPIAADSLAAESIRDKGAFAENDDAVPLSVKGANSTLANEDTSGATILRASSDGTTRQEDDLKGAGSDERGSVGLKYQGGTGGDDNTGFGSDKTIDTSAISSSGSGSTGTGSSAGVRPYVDAAPNYAARTSGAISDDNTFKPKGHNLTEDNNLPEAEPFQGEIGGSDDPGRVAEQKFQTTSADSVGGARGGGQVGGNSSDKSSAGQYDALSSNETS